MRDTISHHTEPLYALPRHYFPPVGPSQRNKRRLNPNHHVYRPALNISGLVDALQVPISNALESRTSPRKGKGTKRVASPAPSGAGRTKRMKRESPEAKSGHDEKKLTEFTWAEMQYPKLKALVPDSARDAGVEIPIMAHTFEMTYSNEIPSGSILGLYAGGDEYEEWPSDEKNLVDALQVLASVMDHDEQEIDLGNALLCSHSSRVVAVSQILAKREGSIDWFLLLPRAADGLDLELLGLPDDGLAETHDVLLQCVKLMQEKRVAIDAKLRLRMRAAEDTILPFSLSLHVTVSLTPRAFGTDGSKSTVETMQRQLIQHVYPDPLVHTGNEDPTVPFFYSVVGPAPPVATRETENALQPAGLVATLLPFQRRSVGWLLAHEGKMVTDAGEIINKPSATQPGFSFWSKIQEGSRVFHVHRITGQLSLTAPEEEEGLGGMLAEEPGLGKTLEIISLLLLNPAGPERHPGNKRWDAEASIEVKTVKTTLIVTPPTLAPQWMDELRTHAPSLKVLLYEGWNKVDVPLTKAELDKARAKSQISKQRKGKGRARDWDEDTDAMDVDTEVLDWASFVQGYDVVVTTYATLSRDVNVARAARQRPRREDVVYAATIERARSPLIMTEWHRVVMDEVQMVGGGQVEDMVSMIPRVSSFAVSGTPARTQVADLIHVLRFLRVDHLVGYSARHWQRLVCAGYSEYFRRFFQGIAVRTTKASIKAELTIPQQTRYLVGIEMGRVERHVYDRNLESILLELGLDARGVDVRGEQRTPDPVILRSLLRKLRAICTHPQIGQLGVNKIFKPGALKSMEEVLQGMCDDNWGLVIEDWRSQIQNLVRTAQLRQHGTEHNRYQLAQQTLSLAETETKMMLDEIRGVLTAHETTNPAQRSASPSALSEAESEDENDSKIDIKTKAYRSKRNALKQRLREAQLVHHRVKFLQGDVCHMLGPSHLDAENAAYEEAELIRRSILNKTEKEARESMKLLEDSETSGDDLKIKTPFLRHKLVKDESAALQQEANQMIRNVLNKQAELVSEWRGQLTGLLMTGLTPDEQADGQEYQRTLDDQGEAEIYLTNYTTLLADYREVLLKEKTALAAHNAKEKKLRETKAAMKATARDENEKTPEVATGIELQPEHEVLHTELASQRKAPISALKGRAIKSIVVEMSTMATRLKRDETEKNTLLVAANDLRKLITEQTAVLDKSETELALYRKVFNQRLLYFRQLQEISDAVTDVEIETTVQDELVECDAEQKRLENQIKTNRARQRYLDNLTKGSNDEEEESTCILCKCDFVRGFITDCAHIFCEDCMKAWISRKEGNACPVCRVPIATDKLQRFVMAEPKAEPAPVQSEFNHDQVPHSRRKIEYNRINPSLFEKIESMPTFGDYGNKIQTLVRHLSYLQTHESGSKSIVFSAWADSLFIVEQALNANGITSLRIDSGGKGRSAVKTFASSDIEVLLLHGERENAGLNITCASRVFLLESVVHHGFEIQAIARIDRMGQSRPTEVFCYYAEGTVERNILDLAARQGTSLYTKNNSVGSIMNGTDLAGTDKPKLESSRKSKGQQKGDFIFKVEDMMAILFPAMFEDVEYLVDDLDEAANNRDVHPGFSGENAVAGPSRIS